MELSMSMLDEFLRCRRRWYYHYGLGLEPKGTQDYVQIGSAFHAGVAYGFENNRGRMVDVEVMLHDMHHGLSEWFIRHPEFPLIEKGALVHDMIDYWWRNDGAARASEYTEILAVEKHLPLDIDGHSIRCTPDLVVRKKNGKIAVPDHKTVGTIGDSLAFLPIDFQLKCYALTVWDEYDEIPQVDYNMVRRELPPGYIRTWDGSFSTPYALTKTGRVSSRSCDVKDYLRYEPQVFTSKQLLAFADELREIVHELVGAIERGAFPRSRSKAGAFGCGGCPYLAACTREADGEKLDAVTLSLEFIKQPPMLESAA